MNVPDALHHPLFQSLVLPMLLSLVGIWLLRPISGPARAAAAVGFSVLVSVVWLMGWPVRPAGVMQKLPWIIAIAWLAGVGLNVAVASRFLQWLCLTSLWLIAAWWLGSKSIAVVSALGGAAVLACLLQPRPDRADAATTAVVASLGLAGLSFAAGSLALFQLSLLLAAAVGGAALWLWPKPRIAFGAAAAAVAGITWLALAQAALLLIPVRPQALALAAAVFAMAPLFGRLRPGAGAVFAPLAIAVLAVALVGGSLVVQSGADAAGSADNGAGAGGDAYYEKK